MRTFLKSTLLLILAFSLFGNSNADALPTPRDAMLKIATQIKFNQTVKITMPDGPCVLTNYPNLKKIKDLCKPGYATANVSGIKWVDNKGMGDGAQTARYAISATISNYFKNSESGLNLFITCSNSTNNGNAYADGKTFNQLPAMSADSGDALVGLPEGQTSSSCIKPVIWIVGDSKDNAADAKKAKTIWAAYIPIPSSVFAGH
jgi:hypothetical protein